MNAVKQFGKHSLWAVVVAVTLLLAGYSGPVLER